MKKELKHFDFDFQPSIDKRQIDELATMRFLENGENIVFLGPPGVGKTHLATAFLLTQALTAERRALRLCKRCGKMFAAGNPKTEYCGVSCRNTANVKRSRARSKCGDKK